jgi:hypothetical protein
MAYRLLLLIAFFAPQLAHAEYYEVEFTLREGIDTKMRDESIYRIESGARVLSQKRIYANDTNELREASFLQGDNKTWETFGADNLPDRYKRAVAYTDGKIRGRRQVETPTSSATTTNTSTGTNPAPACPAQVPGSLTCFRASADAVMCDGKMYFLATSASIQDHGLPSKMPVSAAQPVFDEHGSLLLLPAR